jgi:hypothetical protein
MSKDEESKGEDA